MIGLHWHNESARVSNITTYLSGVKVLQNLDENRFYIAPEWSANEVQAAYDETLKWLSTRTDRKVQPNIRFREIFQTVISIGSLDNFGGWLDHMFFRWDIDSSSNENKSPTPSRWQRKDKAVLRYFLIRLWARKIIIFPSLPYFRWSSLNMDDARGDRTVSDELEALFRGRTGSPARAMKNCLLTCHGVQTINEFVPEIVNVWIEQAVSHGITWPTSSGSFAVAFVRYHAIHNTKVITHTAKSYLNPDATIYINSLEDKEFVGILDEHPDLEEWRNAASQYFEQRRGSRTAASGALWAFLNYLGENKNISREIARYFDRRDVPVPKFSYEANVNAFNEIVSFHEWVISNMLTDVDEESGAELTMPWVTNPLSPLTDKRQRTRDGIETGRRPIPSIVIEKAIEILTKDDWAWSKTVNYYKDQAVYHRNFKEKKTDSKNADWFPVFHPKTLEKSFVWSPVRTTAMYVLLRTAFRSFQVRMLDSGETDHSLIVINNQDGSRHYSKEVNRHPIAAKTPGAIPKGVLQITYDESENKMFPFLRISTNKTADIDKDSWEKGYDCPWAPDDVIDKLIALRNWQQAHNPLRATVNWSEVPELARAKHPEQLAGMTGSFLFRDPGCQDQRLPIKYGKIEVLWTMLCQETERQLAELGFVDDITREPLRLLNPYGRPVYDMHSLRVTQLSSLYKRGVPVKVIMMISGHATVPMCLYYVKYGVAELREVISQAESTNLRTSQQEWASAMADQKLEDLQPLLVHNEYQAVVDFKETSQDAIFLDTGICTAGGSKCSAGIIVRKTKSVTFFGPVPGGRGNCCACIHHISGPPFIHGLNATWNVKSIKTNEVCGRRRMAEELNAELTNESYEEGENFKGMAELKRAGENFSRLTAEADQVIEELRNVSITITQCIQIQNSMNENPEAFGDKFALLANDVGTIKMAFEESSEFDLIDRVLQSSIFFESTKSETVEKANLKRMRYYDQMLQRNGLTPTFWQMDEETALLAGNALTKLLKARVGFKNTLDIVDGLKKLSEFNILPETIYQEIALITAKPVRVQLIRSSEKTKIS